MHSNATFIFCCLSWCVLGAFVRGNELACSSDSDCELLELWVSRGDDNCCLDNRCWNDCSTATAKWVCLRVVLPILCILTVFGILSGVATCIVREQRKEAEEASRVQAYQQKEQQHSRHHRSQQMRRTYHSATYPIPPPTVDHPSAYHDHMGGSYNPAFTM
ncbi:uncharacterized protein LOC134846897 [Symsagittifera roscoffensis]|uniref:uncharacterized protein LOC134846897 n=1 Tax=Symsagittifera roscoffensis TaxID=84072 RepID=UPI00307BB701